MGKRTGRSYESEIKKAFRKHEELNADDEAVLGIIERTIEYFEIFDQCENKNYAAIFSAAFLCPANDGRKILALSNDFGLCERSFLRYKKKILQAYALIYEKYRK